MLKQSTSIRVSLSWQTHLCRCRHSFMSGSLGPHRLEPSRPLCPWDSSGKNTGGGSHPSQVIFLTQGLKLPLLHLLHCQAGFLPLTF